MHIENFSAWHNVPMATKENGMAARHRLHVQLAAARAPRRDALRDGEEGALHLRRAHQPGGSEVCERRVRDADIEHGAQGKFPAEREVRLVGELHSLSRRRQGAPQNSIIGGASLWVMGGKKPAEYKGVAKFFAFLSRPRSRWSGIPARVRADHDGAYEMTRKSGFYDKNPGADVAVKQLTNKPPTANSKGIRFGNYVQGREVIEEEMEAAFAGKKTAKAALDDAVKRGNDILRKFEAANK
jgi:sn-glycerol 3-phosphate transport system substrate-binding protein